MVYHDECREALERCLTSEQIVELFDHVVDVQEGREPTPPELLTEEELSNGLLILLSYMLR